MVRKIFIFIFSLMLILTVWLFSQKDHVDNFNILNMSINNKNEIEIRVEGYDKSKLIFKISSFKEDKLIPLIPRNDDKVLISVVNIDENIYYLAIKGNEGIMKTSFSISSDIKDFISNNYVDFRLTNNCEECYILYPLFFGGLKENYKDLIKTKNSNIRLYTLENDNFKFDFIMNANYIVDAVDNEKAYGSKSELSRLEYYFSLANISVRGYKERWRDIDVDSVSDFFKFKLKPELHINESPSWISRYLPLDLNSDVFYNEDGVIKKYNRQQSPEITDINKSTIKFNDLIDVYELKAYNLNNLEFDGMYPELTGKILSHGFKIN